MRDDSAHATPCGTPRSRFAPSPTGCLHLGHIAHALYVWGLTRLWGGHLVLRIEDHDRTRCKPEFEAAILEDLHWLGLEVDEPELKDFAEGPSPYRQSDCTEHYETALAHLHAAGLVYACDCSRKQVLTRTGQDGGELRYDGYCRTRGLAWTAGRGLRVHLERREVEFVDALQEPPQRLARLGRGAVPHGERNRLSGLPAPGGGHVQIPAEQCGDLLVRDRHGHWTYQFAVVVDDLRHEIELVIRGEDLLESTGRQIQLARLLGRQTPPRFAHHPLITGADGRKLSKSGFAGPVRELRFQGIRPAMVLGLAAHEVGLLPAVRPLSASTLSSCFEE